MAKQVVKKATVYFDTLELAAYLKSAMFEAMAEEVDTTNLASTNGWKEFLGGLKSADWNFDGFLSAADPDATLETAMTGGSAVKALLSLGRPIADGDPAWVQQVIAAKFANMVKIGEAWGFTAGFKCADAGIRGRMLEVVTRTSTGTSAASLTLPALAAGDRLYYYVRVETPTGTTPTLDLVLQSDVDNTFAAPNDQATLTQFTTSAGVLMGYVEGPITDVEWRVSATVGGTSPSYTYQFFIGISGATG